MKKVAVLINGVSAPIKEHNFLSSCLKEIGYEVIAINLVGEKVKFESEKINKYISERVAGRKIDLIMGWSLGALVAPLIIRNYPRAKMILVACGVGNLNILKYLKPIMGIVKHGLNLPIELLMATYEKINPVGDGVREKYRKQMEENIKFFRKIGPERLREVFDFLSIVNNEKILKQIRNKTLVMSGRNDRIFPLSEGEKLSKLLKNGKWVVTDGGHYNVIGREEMPIIKDFLSA